MLNDLVADARALTRRAIRERNLAESPRRTPWHSPGGAEKIIRDADAIRDAALMLRQYLFDGEHGDSAPDMWIVRLAEAIREAATAELDDLEDERFIATPDDRGRASR